MSITRLILYTILILITAVPTAVEAERRYYYPQMSSVGLYTIEVHNLAKDGPPPQPIVIIDQRIVALDEFFAGTPMEGLGKLHVEAADRHGLPWSLMAAIARHESSRGTRMPAGSFNAWGYGPGIRFDSWEEGIETVTARFASYNAVSINDGLCIWVAGSVSRCNWTYVERVTQTLNELALAKGRY